MTRMLRGIALAACLLSLVGWAGQSAATPPTIKILFAGNPDDVGGPYWLPPYESAEYGLADDGYYTDDSKQSEDWIQIRVEATDQHPIASVRLSWLVADSPTSRPTTWGPYSFQWDSGLNCWVIDTSTLLIFPQPQEGTYYSFNVTAIDQGLSTATREWRKTGPGGTTPRRWVQLDCATESIDYRPYYLGLGSYTMNLNPERGTKDRFHHDSGPDHGDWDVGALLDKPPASIEQRHCTQFIGYWFDVSTCVSATTISNIYYHVWTSSVGPNNPVRCVGWGRTREHLALGTNVIDMVAMDSLAHSSYYYNDSDTSTNDNYSLLTGLIDSLDTSETFRTTASMRCSSPSLTSP